MKLLRIIPIIFSIQLMLIFAMHQIGQYRPHRLIAYSSIDSSYDPHVMLYDFNTGVSLELTMNTPEGRLYGRTPIWSSDGYKISYVTYRNRLEAAVYTFDLQTAQLNNLTHIHDNLAIPSYAPDGQYVLQIRNDLVYITPSDTVPLVGSILGDPVFSSNGRYIAYLAVEDRQQDQRLNEDERGDNDPSEYDIWVLDMQTGESRSLTQDIRTHGTPIWSPDSQKIAFRSVESPVSQLFVIDLITGDITNYPMVIYATSALSWSPDNQKITYASSHQSNNLDIFILDTNSSEQTRMTTYSSYDVQSHWSSDGEWLVFVSRRDGQEDLYALHIETGDIRRLTFTPTGEANPVWQPR